MTIHIKSIVLYNKYGDSRELKFSHGLNIIAGDPQTGKSAIIPIIDYCFGNPRLEIRSGVVTDTVYFYAVLYEIDNKKIFVAKPAPRQGVQQSQLYYHESINDYIPDSSFLFESSLDADDDILIQKLSDILGILAPKISNRDSTAFLFQEKSLLDNKERLFMYNVKDEVIKNSLLYFLKIQKDSDIINSGKLNFLNFEHDKVKKSLKKLEKLDEEKILRGQNLLYKARTLGLYNSEDDLYTLDEIKNVLDYVVASKSYTMQDSIIEEDKNVYELENKLKELRSSKDLINRQISQLDEFNKLSKRYSSSIEEHANRLKSASVFDRQDDLFRDAKKCPLCQSLLKNPNPEISAIYKTLEKLNHDLSFVKKTEQPNITPEIDKLITERNMLSNNINEIKSAISKYY